MNQDLLFIIILKFYSKSSLKQLSGAEQESHLCGKKLRVSERKEQPNLFMPEYCFMKTTEINLVGFYLLNLAWSHTEVALFSTLRVYEVKYCGQRCNIRAHSPYTGLNSGLVCFVNTQVELMIR